MKTIGIIGGTSWVSTVDYYKLLNKLIHKRLGESNAARLILYSLNFNDIRQLLQANDWDKIAEIYIDIAGRLKHAGADCLMLAANTPHIIADKITVKVNLPLIHIASATAKAINEKNLKKVAILGTRFTMESSIYPKQLAAFGIEGLIPDEKDRSFINTTIFEELTKDIFKKETVEGYLNIIQKMIEQGAEGIVHACTEIPILLKDCNLQVPAFDTTFIHASATVDFALSDKVSL